MTEVLNHVYYLVCLVVALFATIPPTAFDFLPASWKPYIIGVVVAAAWVKSHWNLFINPDGTSARTAYDPSSTGATIATPATKPN